MPIRLRGAPAGDGDAHLVETSLREIALSPDGRKLALVAHGEVFAAAAAADGGPAQRLTRTATAQSDLAWSPDARRLAFLAENGADIRLMQYDFVTAKTLPLGKGGGTVRRWPNARCSPVRWRAATPRRPSRPTAAGSPSV